MKRSQNSEFKSLNEEKACPLPASLFNFKSAISLLQPLNIILQPVVKFQILYLPALVGFIQYKRKLYRLTVISQHIMKRNVTLRQRFFGDQLIPVILSYNRNTFFQLCFYIILCGFLSIQPFIGSKNIINGIVRALFFIQLKKFPGNILRFLLR